MINATANENRKEMYQSQIVTLKEEINGLKKGTDSTADDVR